MDKKVLWLGIDVGSTTVKIAVVDTETRELIHWDYQRHNADQSGLVRQLLQAAYIKFPDHDFKVAFCGSAGEPFAKLTGAFFIQEVVANTIAIKDLHGSVRTAIELGGQDAKVIFFRKDEKSGQMIASDMKMNGSCAGGTGAFIDQIAELLDIQTEEFNDLASQGTTVYDISGRCGVFAKTDIQPLLNQGVSRADIALSSLHAIAKQTIGGLAQGLDIHPPVIFEGGPLTFNPVLVRVFKERLNLHEGETIIPNRPEVIVALGTALSLGSMFSDRPSQFCGYEALERLRLYNPSSLGKKAKAEKFFESPHDQSQFDALHNPLPWAPPTIIPGQPLSVYLGIDGGSTTTKFVLVDQQGKVVDRFYKGNQGDPLQVLKDALQDLKAKYDELGVKLNILAAGTTGYGELLFAKALKADFHTVETVAHAKAAQKVCPDVTFILDIGGQDMKAIFVNKGIVTAIVLNEACSAGCGSFLETYAKSLKIQVQDIAPMSFQSENPSHLGSRCTVFMNSSIISEQKSGKTTSDIMGGLCRSVIENVFTKVIRISNLESLGPKVVVQGGTFKNDAVLRAFEQYTGRSPIRPPLPGEMGAIGIALLTKDYVEETFAEQGMFQSTFIGLDDLDQFSFKKEPGQICHFCANNCNRTVVTFGDGSAFITGNRCEKGEILGDVRDPEIQKKLRETSHIMDSVPDMIKRHHQLLMENYHAKNVGRQTTLTIGLPRTLEFWSSLPFWRTIFEALGIRVKVSRKSSYELYEKGLPNVPSDTACFPAKITHGHVRDLIEQDVDRIFMPMMILIPTENKTNDAQHMCPLVQGYPVIINNSDEPFARHGIPFDHPVFHWYNEKLKRQQTLEYLTKTLGVTQGQASKAFKEGERAQKEFLDGLEREGKRVLDSLRDDEFAVVVAGRPYHSDELINHGLSSHFTKLGIPVITLDSLPMIHQTDLSKSRIEAYNPFHMRLISAAIQIAENPKLEMVQIVSFGCGHDAILSDEVNRILREKADKELLILKLDEGENKGPVSIRVKSFVETIRTKRKAHGIPTVRVLSEPYPVKFTEAHKKTKTILAPNLSPAFSRLISRVIEMDGYKMYPMPLADTRAIELGKKYVHNDICFPAQINIGEALAVLESGKFDPDELALGLAKNCEDCRAGQYLPLARKALDEAGYPQVPIITTGEDTKDYHPGFKLSHFFQIRMIWGLALTDSLEMMRHAIRPYELNPGETEKVFEEYLERATRAIQKSVKLSKEVMIEAVQAFNAIPSDRTVPKPRVGILGEVLINYHPTANGRIEEYLESHGMEVIMPSLTDFFRKNFTTTQMKGKRNLIPNRFLRVLVADVAEHLFVNAANSMQAIVKDFKYHKEHFDISDLARNIEGIVDETYQSGEGWLMAGEILELAKDGVNSFVILNPFGCLPNHIAGRGLIKPIKKRMPHIQIISLDFDPDTSFANIENRLQMLIITAKELEKSAQHIRTAAYNER